MQILKSLFKKLFEKDTWGRRSDVIAHCQLLRMANNDSLSSGVLASMEWLVGGHTINSGFSRMHALVGLSLSKR